MLQFVGTLWSWVNPVGYFYYPPVDEQPPLDVAYETPDFTGAGTVTPPYFTEESPEEIFAADNVINFPTFEAQRLERPFPELYSTSIKLDKLYTQVVSQVSKNTQQPPSQVLRAQAEQLFADCYQLELKYTAYLMHYHDEEQWLKQMPTPLSSLSDKAYSKMHFTVLKTVLKLPIVLMSQFKFEDRVLTGLSCDVDGYCDVMTPSCCITRALRGVNLDRFLCAKLKLYELFFIAHANLSNKEGLKAVSRHFSDFMNKAGDLIKLVAKSNPHIIEYMFSESRAFLSQSSMINNVHYLMMEQVLRGGDSQKYEYLFISLGFAMYLLKPQMVCPLLYYLNGMQSEPGESMKTYLVDLLSFFLLRSIPDHIKKQLEKLEIRPQIQALLFLKQEGWLKRYVTGSEAPNLYKHLDAIAQTCPCYASCEPQISRPEIWAMIFESFNTHKASQEQKKELTDPPERQVVIHCLKIALSIPAILNQKVRQVQRVKKDSSGELRAMAIEASKLQNQILPKGGRCYSTTLTQTFFTSCEQLMKQYEHHLLDNPEEQALLNNVFGLITHQNKRKTKEIKECHFRIQKLKYYLMEYECLGSEKLIKATQLIETACKTGISEVTMPMLNKAMVLQKEVEKESLNLIQLLLRGAVCCNDETDSSIKPKILYDGASFLLTAWQTFLVNSMCIEKHLSASDELVKKMNFLAYRGEFYKNRAYLFEACAHPGLTVIPSVMRQQIHCIELIVCPESTVEALEMLNTIPSSELNDVIFKLVFFTLTTRLKQQKEALAHGDASFNSDLETAEAIMNSFKQGWLQQHWFKLVIMFEGDIPESHNLLFTLQSHYSEIELGIANYKKRREQEYKKTIEMLTASTEQSDQKPATKKGVNRPLKQRSTMWDENEPELKPKPEANVSDADKLFMPMEALIDTKPAEAIVQLEQALIVHEDNLPYCVRAQIDLIEAGIELMRPTIRELAEFKNTVENFKGNITLAISQPPYKFNNPKLYQEMIHCFEKMPKLCEQLNAGLNSLQKKAKNFNSISAQDTTTAISNDIGIYLVVCRKLLKFNEQITDIGSMLSTVEECGELRQQHNKLLSEEHKTQAKVKNYQSREKTKKAFLQGSRAAKNSAFLVKRVVAVVQDLQINKLKRVHKKSDLT